MQQNDDKAHGLPFVRLDLISIPIVEKSYPEKMRQKKKKKKGV